MPPIWTRGHDRALGVPAHGRSGLRCERGLFPGLRRFRLFATHRLLGACSGYVCSEFVA